MQCDNHSPFCSNLEIHILVVFGSKTGSHQKFCSRAAAQISLSSKRAPQHRPLPTQPQMERATTSRRHRASEAVGRVIGGSFKKRSRARSRATSTTTVLPPPLLARLFARRRARWIDGTSGTWRATEAAPFGDQGCRARTRPWPIGDGRRQW